MHAGQGAAAAPSRKPLYTHLYFQVVTAIVIGVLLGTSIRRSASR